jgi:hypothetical protein
MAGPSTSSSVSSFAASILSSHMASSKIADQRVAPLPLSNDANNDNITHHNSSSSSGRFGLTSASTADGQRTLPANSEPRAFVATSNQENMGDPSVYFGRSFSKPSAGLPAERLQDRRAEADSGQNHKDNCDIENRLIEISKVRSLVAERVDRVCKS